ncbi:MAG: hypothetical protein HYR72_21055 [Deltaproteobacteria bacterium]|nr:hypothetical protein [Deltaproteobacteria bacterium]MBI3386637.1 hypothetical protein [Deltaproteobacteria bacterium]
MVRRRGRDQHEVRVGSRRYVVFTEMMVTGPFDFVVDRDSVREVGTDMPPQTDREEVLRHLCRYFELNRYRYDFY